MKVVISDILNQLPPLNFMGNKNQMIDGVVQLNELKTANLIAWCSDKNANNIKDLKAGTIIISDSVFQSLSAEVKTKLNVIVTDNPRRYFMNLLKKYFASGKKLGEVDSSASIHSSVNINKQKVYIGKNVVIEENCSIGDGTEIMHNTVILAGTIIGNNCKIGSNCTLGGIGFGYEKNEDGVYEQIIHIGNVVLEEQVEIGNNVAIDRAVMGSTYLSRNVKVDNLVHIAHGVKIGENSLIIANVMIAGSAVIGKNVWVAPSSSIIQKVTIGDNALVGMAANVLKNVEENSVVAGNPAKKIK